jgi:predicted RNA-binding Zn ribbon-like protein
MSHKQLEKVLEHLLNHDQEAAGDLLHSYFVEKGRGIYESMIQSDEQIEEEIGGDPVHDFEEEVIADEAEIENEEMFSEEDGDMDPEAAADEMSPDAEMPAGDMEAAPEDETKSSVEDAMMDVEDAISALKAEFDKLVNGEGEEAAPADDAEEAPTDMPEESLGEAVDLAKVTSPDNGDKADNKSSPVRKADAPLNGAAAVKFGQGNETGGKVAAPKSLNSTTEPNVKPAPKPVTAQASGVNVKSPISGA